MSTYTLSIFTSAAFGGSNTPPNWHGSGDTVSSNGTGASWEWAQGVKFTLDTSSLTQVTINDTEEGAAGSTFDDSSTGSSNQIVTSTSNSSVAAEGLHLEDEYEVTLAATDGTEYRLVAVSDGTNIIGYTFDGAWPPAGTELQVVPNSWDDDQSMVPCFTAGVELEAPNGVILVEDIEVGDRILTRDHGAQEVRWIGSRHLSAAYLKRNPNLQPIRIKAGALGMNTPKADLVVSPQHRVLVRSKISERMFDHTEVLVAAKQLLQLDGIDIAYDLTEVTYYHVLFDQHEVLMSNGAETESLHTGKVALEAVGKAARDEIFAIFPELRDEDYVATGARMLTSGRQARKMIVRHINNGQSLVN